MIRKIVLLAVMAMMTGCPASEEDTEDLEVSDEEGNIAEDNMGDQNLASQENIMGNEEIAFDNQQAAEDGSAVDNNMLGGDNQGFPANDSNVDVGGNIGGDEGIGGFADNTEDTGDAGAMMAGGDIGEGGVVRYTMMDGVNVYEQADSSSAVLRTLSRGEVLLVTMQGDFAQSAMGFVAVSDLSAEMQPRSFMGNDWR